MSKIFYDTYFLDFKEALKISKEKNRVATSNPHVNGLQICYYSGVKLKKSPKNCIYVKMENMVDFFSKTKYRVPTKLNFDNSNYKDSNSQERFINAFNKIFIMINDKISQKHLELERKIQKLKPDFNDKIFRIFIPACRETTVMQYVSKNIADSFKKLGYDITYNIQTELEDCSTLSYLNELYKCNPHIIININHLNNTFLNKKIFNFTWFQDVMPILINDKPIVLRERDFIFSYTSLFTELLLKKGVSSKKIFKQNIIPVDINEFYNDKKIERKDKIVFVGSFYNYTIDKNITSELNSLITKGKVLTSKIIVSTLLKYDIDIINNEVMINNIQQGHNRNKIVSWLSEYNTKCVEIYGRDWDKVSDQSVILNFKGPIAKANLNMIYNSAKYVLSVSGRHINTQRLGELVHAGAIPLVYDSRELTDEKETWDDECLYFKTRKELYYILDNNIVPKKYMSKKMLNHFTYKKFIKKIENTIKKELGK